MRQGERGDRRVHTHIGWKILWSDGMFCSASVRIRIVDWGWMDLDSPTRHCRTPAPPVLASICGLGPSRDSLHKRPGVSPHHFPPLPGPGAPCFSSSSSMPTSEIDDIFASKARRPPSAPSKASSSSCLPSNKDKKNKNKNKNKRSQIKDEDKPLKRKRGETDDAPAPPKSAKRKVPETVFDPSAALPSAKQSKTLKAEKFEVDTVKSKKPKRAREEEHRFKDSRGTDPREYFLHMQTCFSLSDSPLRSQNRGRICNIQGA